MINTLNVQSLNRAFDIMEAIGDSYQPVTLKEITLRTGIAKTTAYRLLTNLEHRHYVLYDAGGYRLSFQLPTNPLFSLPAKPAQESFSYNL